MGEASSPSVNRLVELQARKNELSGELRRVNDEMARVQEQVIDAFVEAGVQSLKTKSGQTVFLHTQVWANAREGDYDRACDALVVAGYEDFVERRFNTNKVSALVRELRQERGEEGVPLPVRDALQIREVVSARVRGSGS
jgi:hypothetical protein